MRRLLAATACLLFLQGCAAVPKDPLPTVPNVDLKRFMGDWYVIAHIPTFIEDTAYNAIERYDLNADGTIATTFTFRAGGFDGEPKKYTPKGFVRDRTNNSTWGMQFVWPIKAEFLISYLDADYTQTIIARNARDYVWIMARTPEIPAADYERLVAQLASWGYDTGKLRKVPQRWLEGPGVAAAETGTATAAAPAPPSATPGPAALAYPKVKPTELARIAKDVVVLDVRAPQEFADGHVPGAINVPHDQLEARLAELDALRGQPVVVYCRSGRRAEFALDVLSRHGFADVRHLEGDMPGWTAADQPVATGAPARPAG